MGGLERLVSVGLVMMSCGLFVPLVYLPRFYWLCRADGASDKTIIYSKTMTSFGMALLLSLPLWLQLVLS